MLLAIIMWFKKHGKGQIFPVRQTCPSYKRFKYKILSTHYLSIKALSCIHIVVVLSCHLTCRMSVTNYLHPTIPSVFLNYKYYKNVKVFVMSWSCYAQQKTFNQWIFLVLVHLELMWFPPVLFVIVGSLLEIKTSSNYRCLNLIAIHRC